MTYVLAAGAPQQAPRTFQAEWPESLQPGILSCISNLFSCIANIPGRYLIPATNLDRTELSTLREKLLTRPDAHHITALTPDNVHLDGVLFRGESVGHAIVYVPGNNASYETSTHQINLLLATGASVLVLNRRGVGESEGEISNQGLALDVYTAYEYLIQQEKLAPANIFGWGHSMGGADLNRGAALIQEKYPNALINVCNDRSFADLSSQAYHTFGGGYLATLACIALRFFGWQMDSLSAFSTLKGNHQLVISHNRDPIISPKLGNWLSDADLRRTLHIDMRYNEQELRNGPSEDAHNRDLMEDEQQLAINRCKAALRI